MPMDPKGYNPPVLCMVRDCGEEAVIEDYVIRADGVESLDLRLCDRHKSVWESTGIIPNSV
jgi:hypothetical protein